VELKDICKFSSFLAEKEHGSVLKGLVAMKKNEPPEPDKSSTEWSKVFATARKRGWATYSLENGIESLPEALADQLRRLGVKIYLGSPAKAVSFTNKNLNSSAVVDLGFEKLEASHVVATIPAYSLAPLLERTLSSTFLTSVPFVDVAVVNLEFEGQLLRDQAFGYLVPSHQTYSKALGVTFDTCCFPQKDRTILTCMMGGKWFEELFGTDPNPEDLLKAALAEVSERLKINKAPDR
jgi:oxygen-dependent protoporphyrinogen oxidase